MTFEGFTQRYQKAPVQEFPTHGNSPAPVATVRVLVYNHAPYLSRCLDSILAQKCRFPFEVLIAEDESTDGSREICLDYAKRYPERIRLLLNDRRNNIQVNGGPSGIFNSIYSNFKITSKYTALCEADDYWTDLQSLEKRLDFMERHPDVSMCFHHGFRFSWDRGETTSRGHFYDDNGNLLTSRFVMDFGPLPPTPSILYRRAWVEPAHPTLIYAACGDNVLVEKLRHRGPMAFLGDISPAMIGLHPQSSFRTKSNEAQEDMRTETYRAILNYFRARGMRDTAIKRQYLECVYRPVQQAWHSKAWPRFRATLGPLVTAMVASPLLTLNFVRERLPPRKIRLKIRPIDNSGNIQDHVIRYYT